MAGPIDGYGLGPGGYYKQSDGSGPYTIDSSGVAVLLSAGGGGGGGGASTIADGADVAQGAVADAAATAGGTGTLSAKLRRLMLQLPAALGIQTAAASLSTAPASDAVFSVASAPATPTDCSGTITTGGTAQQVAAGAATRRGFMVQNQSAGSLWVSTLATAVAGQPSILIQAGAMYETPLGGGGTGAISIIGATTGQAFAARTWV